MKPLGRIIHEPIPPRPHAKRVVSGISVAENLAPATGALQKSAFPVCIRADSETPLRLQLAITNAGDRAGSEVVQVYFGKTDSAVTRPVKQLVAFNKISLAAGKTKRITTLVSCHAPKVTLDGTILDAEKF